MRNKNKKIGPRNAPYSIPWHVSIWNLTHPHICNGVIVDHWTILTDCTFYGDLWNHRVMVGGVKLKEGISKVLQRDLYHQLLLVKVLTPFHFNQLVMPACLKSENSPSNYKDCYFSGWGDGKSLKWYNVDVLKL